MLNFVSDKLMCAHPLGMRYWKEEKIVYVDAKLGVFVADFKTGNCY